MCFGPGDTWMRTLDETDSYIAIPLEQDGLRPSLLFAGTLACVQKRSQLVPTVSVISSGLLSTKSMAARTTFALT